GPSLCVGPPATGLAAGSVGAGDQRPAAALGQVGRAAARGGAMGGGANLVPCGKPADLAEKPRRRGPTVGQIRALLCQLAQGPPVDRTARTGRRTGWGNGRTSLAN